MGFRYNLTEDEVIKCCNKCEWLQIYYHGIVTNEDGTQKATFSFSCKQLCEPDSNDCKRMFEERKQK